MDILSEIIVQLVFGSAPSSQASVYHLVNPTKITWSSLLPAVVARLQNAKKGAEVKVVSWPQWVEAVTRLAAENHREEDLSATKLTDFFNSLTSKPGEDTQDRRATFDTTLAVANSNHFKQLSAVNGNWMDIWLEQWGY